MAGTKEAAAARRATFVEAYIANGGNASEAAITAGFAKKSAKVTGSQLLTEPNVAAAIADRRAKLQRKHELTTDRVLAELAKIAFADLRKVFAPSGALLPPEQWPDDVAAAMAGVDVVEMAGGAEVSGEGASHIPMFTKKVKLWDKNAALEKAMKHLGLFEKDNAQAQPITIIATVHDERL